MAQCSRCLIPWTANEGTYLMEVDRVLRPGGYWVFSGPPINWKTYYKTWNRTKADLRAEQKRIEDIAESLCWEKKYEKGDTAIFRKKINDRKDTDDVWYKEIETCVTPFPKVSSEEEVAGGKLKKFPERLLAVPPSVSKGLVSGVDAEAYQEDIKLWKKRMERYKSMNSLIGLTRYRNVMDMNAGLAIIAVLGSIILPYPPRAFDMAQCSRCLIPWTANEGTYLMEVDRVLRPRGYWVFSGPPINWKTYYKTWNRTKADLRAEQKRIEDIAESLCWEKKYEKGDTAIFRKKINDRKDTDDVWYKEIETCVTPFPKVSSEEEVAGGKLKKFPERLLAVPPSVSKGLVSGVDAEAYQEDIKLWKKRVARYKSINSLIGLTRYRNVMDMNAGLGCSS
ncbi:unnamed protein product [Eruca vesicaria subsp. sativa]|uniref:Methyltransferase n=1 Tax=Eruca vesicaria subsp. sativa TaxID=29727 RepID=A0ABC8LFG5_ERUVS|nr:unnamed protein product [Eruca vesicaria subsp. sativa]